MNNLRQGTYSVYGEKLDWTYWDTIVLAYGTTSHRMFTTPLGQSSKNLDLTNMRLAGMIPTGQRLVTKRIKAMYSTANAFATADVQYFYSMLAQTTVEVIISGKDSLFECTLHELFGAANLCAVTPSVSGDNISIIQPRYHGIYPLNKALILAENTNFEVRVIHQTAHNTALDNDRLTIGLSGILERRS